MLATFTHFSCRWHWTNKHIPLVKPSECSTRSLGSLDGMKWHWTSLWACGTSGINRAGKGSVVGTEMAAFSGGGTQKNPWNPATPCSWIHICFAGTSLQAPHPPAMLQNELPRVCFDSLLGTDPVSQGHCHLLKALQVLTASGALQSALHNPGFYQGKQIHHIRSVCLELSPLIYSF